MPTLPYTPRLPMVTEAPRGPTESDAPVLPTLTRTPGKSVMRFENLKPMIRSPLICSAGNENADDGFPQPLDDVAAVIVVGEIGRRDVYSCGREHLVNE